MADRRKSNNRLCRNFFHLLKLVPVDDNGLPELDEPKHQKNPSDWTKHSPIR